MDLSGSFTWIDRGFIIDLGASDAAFAFHINGRPTKLWSFVSLFMAFLGVGRPSVSQVKRRKPIPVPERKVPSVVRDKRRQRFQEPRKSASLGL